jgi:hypothetical protein
MNLRKTIQTVNNIENHLVGINFIKNKKTCYFFKLYLNIRNL